MCPGTAPWNDVAVQSPCSQDSFLLSPAQLIGTPILYNGIMKPMARQVLINTAEKNGVRWRNAVSEWEQSKGEVDAEFARLTNPAVTYPVRLEPACFSFPSPCMGRSAGPQCAPC